MYRTAEGQPCGFVHIDAVTPDADKSKYAFMRRFLDQDGIKDKIELTDDGKAAIL